MADVKVKADQMSNFLGAIMRQVALLIQTTAFAIWGKLPIFAVQCSLSLDYVCAFESHISNQSTCDVPTYLFIQLKNYPINRNA